MFRFTFLLFFMSCAFKPYRATLGITSSSSSFSSITSDSNGNESTRNLCVGNPPDIQDAEKCSGGGFKEFNEESYLEPWLEFTPTYFGTSNFGWSYFFAYNYFQAELLDYPNNGQKSNVKMNRASVNPIVYYNLGDKFITNNGGLAFRIGLGLSLNYLIRFEVQRESDKTVHEQNNKFKLGTSAFFEFNWHWFILRGELASMKFGDRKFDDGPNDDLEVNTNKVSFLYSYYFK